jgi:hypothetical protein
MTTAEERVKVAARVLVRHLSAACKQGRCSCGEEWNLKHQAHELDKAGLLCALVSKSVALAAIETVHIKGTPMCGATEVPAPSLSMMAQLAAETRYCTRLIGHAGPHECEGVPLRDPVHVPGHAEWCKTCHNPWPCPSVAALLDLVTP